jgi:hypothetical protein
MPRLPKGARVLGGTAPSRRARLRWAHRTRQACGDAESVALPFVWRGADELGGVRAACRVEHRPGCRFDCIVEAEESG